MLSKEEAGESHLVVLFTHLSLSHTLAPEHAFDEDKVAFGRRHRHLLDVPSELCRSYSLAD